LRPRITVSFVFFVVESLSTTKDTKGHEGNLSSEDPALSCTAPRLTSIHPSCYRHWFARSRAYD